MTNDAFESILNQEFRWPRRGDKPFTRSKDWRANAAIEAHGHGRLVLMMTGYKRAGDALVTKASATGYDRDTLIYPIVFNYRQFIELSLKYLIAGYGPAVGIEANWTTHDLARLWQTFRQVLNGYGLDATDEGDVAAGHIIAEFAKVDPKSFAYRYPVDIHGRPIPLPHDALDLAALADVMQGLDSYFSGCDGYLDNLHGAGP